MRYIKAGLLVMSLFLVFTAEDCGKQAESASGVKRADVKIDVNQTTGMTVEQENYTRRIKQDNTPGAVKHLYVISPYSGQVIIYSTVRGKVTSSEKRLTPSQTSGLDSLENTFTFEIGSSTFHTVEVLGDDGTYGTSDPYIYWFDSKGIYHQHFMTGGQIVHVSSEPLVVKSVIINIEETVSK